jgi:hypothetical protein
LSASPAHHGREGNGIEADGGARHRDRHRDLGLELAEEPQAGETRGGAR